MRLYSNKHRPFHLGPWPLEKLPRTETIADGATPRQPGETGAATVVSLAPAFPEYFELFRKSLRGTPAPAPAPVPNDVAVRANNLKSHAYFLDASLVGTCELEDRDWIDTPVANHRYALVFLIEFGREPNAGEPGAAWIAGSNVARTDLRATELAVVLSGYIRAMGFAAQGHAAGATAVHLERLAIKAGLARRNGDALAAPFLRRGFRIGVVTTEYALAADAPLATDAPLAATDNESFMGTEGTLPGWWYDEEASRPLHMGRYAMEKIKRVDTPTTLLVPDEIKRVPKRGDFFKRAQSGDLGERPKQERMRFAMKHPFALGMQPLIQGMVALQGTREKLPPSAIGDDLGDRRRNADAMKALGYYLGADFVGICRTEPWMFYSHDDATGVPIERYHDYAVVMLIDQGFETMEGASGDDWISASQSMRAYMRGAEIAGLMAAQSRRLGYSARAHSNAHSEVIHNPCILMAGLGEVSRIGDTILNPFIGPRSKSVVFTTDLPMEVDLPIDFGLQNFCDSCRKCARECPCNAIPFGPKVMFNGYEIWKADVEKCTKYRVTNSKGSACGRCMKMCPWNREDLMQSEQLMWLSINNPAAAAAIALQDDADGNGMRNPIKRWWFDLEVVDGTAIAPRAGVNERDMDVGRVHLAEKQRLAMFPPSLQPPPGSTLKDVHPVDRIAGQKLYEAAESPEAARKRLGADRA
ncbi:MAG: reductive dehalogenase domain-containing protein [Alphaproteobacteria bacterium]